MANSSENPPDSQKPSSFEEGPTYHYDREARLKRVHRDLYPETGRRKLFRRKRTKGLLIILIDLVLIAVVYYFISKPVNVFLEKTVESTIYQLNITGIRGKKVLVGFTVKNSGDYEMIFSENVPVTVEISRDENPPLTFQRYIEAPTTLDPGESSAVIFLLEEANLPSSATVELFYGESSDRLFSKHVRF